MTRKEQIEKAAHSFAKENSQLDKNDFSYGWGFQEGARWADKTNPAVAALNKIALLQSGELDYTNDFFEQCKMIVRTALGDMK